MFQLAKTVFLSGNFNTLHPGHLRLFRLGRELGDELIVGVQSDRLAGAAAHVPEGLRIDGVRSISFVSSAFLVDEPVEKVIERLRPDFVVKGYEHEGRMNPELEVLNGYGGKLVFSSGEAVFSSLDLIRMDLVNENRRLSTVPKEFLARNGIETRDVVAQVGEFGRLRVCVVGDLIVDEYITCEPLGMSQEDPTIVVTPVDTRRFIGGAGIVAAHAAGLEAEVHYLSVTGNDEPREYALRNLRDGGVRACLLEDDTRPTTLKQRFRANGMTLLRVSHLHQASIDLNLQDQIFERFDDLAASCQLLVFSDYNYGCLPQTLVDRLVKRAREAGMTMAADSQCSSQIGDVSRFRGMSLLTPTEHEARVSLRNQQDGLVVLSEKLRAASEATNIILKLGAEGILLHVHGDDGSLQTDRLPGLNSQPLDIMGAGDSHLISSAMAIAVGANPWEAAYIGSVAAAVQVSRTGNIPLTQADLVNEIG
ncbi:MAG: ADP-heptose synthase [Acidobacteria bacterium]|nr:ADP-heptose synthase [Acidobacteriota bacterium]